MVNQHEVQISGDTLFYVVAIGDPFNILGRYSLCLSFYQSANPLLEKKRNYLRYNWNQRETWAVFQSGAHQ